MNELDLRQAYVNQMLSWENYSVADGRHKQIIDIYNNHKPLPNGYAVKYTDAWCATTVSAAAIKVGITDIIPKECSCKRMIDGFIKLGRWVENDRYVPKIGDIIFYDWDWKNSGENNSGWPDHVGVVCSVNGTNMTIIEGNISKKVGRRNITTDYKFIRGYGIPDYAKKAASMSTAPSVTPVTQTPSTNTNKQKTVTASVLNIRKASNSNLTTPIVGTLKNGSVVTVIKEENGFAYIEGWISTKYIK